MNSLTLILLLALSGAGDGHQLKALWDQYDKASKADRPKQEAELLQQIKTQAQEQHLTVDFWDAATLYVQTVQRRDWKQRNSLREQLATEVESFNEPVVTFLWMKEWQYSSTQDLKAYLQQTPLQGNNPALHRGVDHYLNGALTQFMDSDAEWALWLLQDYQALEPIVKGRYPQEGALKYYQIEEKQKKEALQAFQKEYQGKALAFYPEGDLLQTEMQELEKQKAGQDAFKDLYNRCKDFERRRAASTEKAIAGSYTDIDYLVKRLTSSSLQLRTTKDTLYVAFRNLKKAKVTLYKDKSVVTEWNASNTTGSFYVYDTLALAMPQLPDGIYSLEAVNGKVSTSTLHRQYTISIATRTDADGRKVYVADYKTGEPFSTVQLLLMKGDTEVAKSTIKIDGFTKLPSAFDKVINAHPKNGYKVVAVSGDRRSLPQIILREANVRIADVGVKCNVYRDRGAYTPGDTLKFKAVVYQGDPMTKLSVCPGRQIEVRFSDTEGNLLTSLKLKTNEYGSASGEFAIPEGLRNGMFSMQVREKDNVLAWGSFRVDQFIIPSFVLSFDKRTELYLEGSNVPVSGTVKSLSGHGLSGASIRIKATRWGQTVIEEEKPLSADGIFRFEVPAAATGHYNAQVTVVDATGETLSFNDSFYVGRSLNVDIKVLGAEDSNLNLPSDNTGGWRYRREPRYVVRSTQIQAVFQAKDFNNNPVPMDVRYELRKDASAQITGVARSGEETAISAPETGLYVLSATVEATLPDGEKIVETTENRVLVLAPGETELKVPGSRLFIAGPATVNDSIKTQLGTSEGDAWVVTAIFGKDSQLLLSGTTQVKDGQIQDMNYEYKASWPDAVRLVQYYFIDSHAVKYERQYRRERTKLTLPLEFTSFRSNAFPGTRYTFTLKTDPGVEAVAAAWDKGLDAIARNYWAQVTQADYSVPSVTISATPGSIDDGAFYSVEAVPYALSARGTKAVTMNKSVSFDAMEDSVSAEMAVEEAAEPEEGVRIRSEFLSALTFQPHLVSAKDGSLSFSFSTSDKLSTYYVRVYAHDKAMRNALTEDEMLVTIPVKVALREPRYLYAGDVWDAAITVSSIADEPVSGVLSLQWDGGSAQLPVTVPAGETITKVISVVIPGSSVTVTASFRAAAFSDAMQVTVPVLPAAQTLTESHSAVLRPGMDREALLQDLRSRFVNVPGNEAVLKEISVLDMVRDAIPQHVEPNGKDVLSLTEALYVQLIANSLEIHSASGLGKTNDDTPVIPNPEGVSVSQNNLLAKILSCRNADGGFAWFEGMNSSPIITAVVLERFAKLRDRGVEVPDLTSSVKYLDERQFGESRPVWRGWLSDAQYMHVRAMYANVPFMEKGITKERVKSIKSYLLPSAKEGRGLQGQILAKARRLLTLRNLLERDGGIDLAKAWGVTLPKARIKSSIKADTVSLLEYAVEHRDGGWYYPNAVMPWRGLLESEAYAHALLCELLSPSAVADGIRLWLMLQKETQKWDADPAFVDAISAILDGSEDVLGTKVLALSAAYSAPFSEIKASGNGFTVERHFYNGDKEVFPGDSLKVGDRIRVVYKIWNGENRSFVKLTAARETALDPVQQLSGMTGGWFNQGYRNVTESATEYYYDSYPEENTEVVEEFYVTRAGAFSAPVTVIESLYAPHYRANSDFRATQKVLPASN